MMATLPSTCRPAAGLVTLAMAVSWPAAAQAQAAAPGVEVGVHGGGLLASPRPTPSFGPRLTIRFDTHTAFEVLADLQRPVTTSPFETIETDMVYARVKRTVFARAATSVFATIGGGGGRARISTSEQVFGAGPVVLPATSVTTAEMALVTGGGIDVRLAPRLRLILESEAMFGTGGITGRVVAGLAMPLQALPSPGAALPADVPWARLEAGDRAWVTTTDGRSFDGEVVSRTRTELQVATGAGRVALSHDDIQRLSTADPIRDGTMRGFLIGGFSALGYSAFGTVVVCATESCSGGDIVRINGILGGLGFGIGATIGALTDSFRERPVEIYRRGAAADISVIPVVSRRSAGVGGAIRW